MESLWLQAFHGGDETVFERAVAEHSSRLKAYCRAFVEDDATAEDLVQEAWLQAYRKRRSFEGRGSFLGWLLAICRTTALSHVRTNRRRGGPSGAQHALAGQNPPGSPEQADVLERMTQREEVKAALLALPPRQRDTVVLRVLEDRSVRDTARIMGCAEGTVKAALSKALNHLRRILDEETGQANRRQTATDQGRQFVQHGELE